MSTLFFTGHYEMGYDNNVIKNTEITISTRMVIDIFMTYFIELYKLNINKYS